MEHLYSRSIFLYRGYWLRQYAAPCWAYGVPPYSPAFFICTIPKFSRKVLLGLRPKPRQGAEPLGTCNGFDVFVNEPGTDNTRFLEKWGPAPPFFVPATYHFVSLL